MSTWLSVNGFTEWGIPYVCLLYPKGTGKESSLSVISSTSADARLPSLTFIIIIIIRRETRIDVLCAGIVSTCCVLDGRIVPVRRSVTSSKTHLVDRDVTTENVVDVLRVVSDHILDGLPLVSGNVIIINLFSLSEKFISSKQDVFVYIILLKENKTYSSSVERRRVICIGTKRRLFCMFASLFPYKARRLCLMFQIFSLPFHGRVDSHLQTPVECAAQPHIKERINNKNNL